MADKDINIEVVSKNPFKQRRINKAIIERAQLAERVVYKYIGKDYAAIMKEYGEIPAPIRSAALLATADIFLTTNNNNRVFKMLLEPYKKKDDLPTPKEIAELRKQMEYQNAKGYLKEIWHRGSERPKTDGFHVVEVLAIINNERHLGNYVPDMNRLSTLEDEGDSYEWDKVDYWAYTEDLMSESVKSIK